MKSSSPLCPIRVVRTLHDQPRPWYLVRLNGHLVLDGCNQPLSFVSRESAEACRQHLLRNGPPPAVQPNAPPPAADSSVGSDGDDDASRKSRGRGHK